MTSKIHSVKGWSVGTEHEADVILLGNKPSSPETRLAHEYLVREASKRLRPEHSVIQILIRQESDSPRKTDGIQRDHKMRGDRGTPRGRGTPDTPGTPGSGDTRWVGRSKFESMSSRQSFGSSTDNDQKRITVYTNRSRKITSDTLNVNLSLVNCLDCDQEGHIFEQSSQTNINGIPALSPNQIGRNDENDPRPNVELWNVHPPTKIRLDINTITPYDVRKAHDSQSS